MTQQKIDELFSCHGRSSNKRSRIINQNERDDFDDLFEIKPSTAKRHCVNNNTQKNNKSDIFELSQSSISTNKINSIKKKRSFNDDDDDENNKTKGFDDLFNNDIRKKIRRPISSHDEPIDLLDMFQMKTNSHMTQIKSTYTDIKPTMSIKNVSTQNKVKMLFDEYDIKTMKEEENDTKDYVQIKPVIVTSGQWLSKKTESKSLSKINDSSNSSNVDTTISDDQRNLMHIQYVSLVIDDDEISQNKPKQYQIKCSNKSILDGKTFSKQLVRTDSTIVRREHLQSCYNSLLEDLNKPKNIESTF